mmetsp:Transcript_24177/g.48096  ORF Transcript_24177/g.48096 Transcript_24177/m.48096 type:complete len:95 (-) Transcript_24177:54-338(-)
MVILCSDEYLLSALRVAYSLADWISKAEENGSEILPIPSSDWSDGILLLLSCTRQQKLVRPHRKWSSRESHEAEFLTSLLNSERTCGSKSNNCP